MSLCFISKIKIPNKLLDDFAMNISIRNGIVSKIVVFLILTIQFL